MAFAQANIENRLRYPIRGRVLGFTDSTHIEFLDSKLKYSYPLWSYNDGVSPFPAGQGVAFCLELDGFLTFAPGSEVRLLDVASSGVTHYGQNCFNVCFCADPFQPSINELTGIFNRDTGFYEAIKIAYYTKPGFNGDYVWQGFKLPHPITPETFVPANFPMAPYTLYQGPNGYPGYTPFNV